MQHGLAFHVAEIHAAHAHVARQLYVAGTAVRRFGRQLPGPVFGALSRLLHGAVLCDADVHQGHLALVHLRLFVHQIEDALRAGQSHDDGVDLLGDHGDGAAEVLGKGEERRQISQGQTRIATDRDGAACDGDHHVLQIADVVHDGAEDVGIAVGPRGLHAQIFVLHVEARFGLILVAEDLYDLLAVDHLLDVGVHAAQRLRAGREIFGRLTAHRHRNEVHHDDDADLDARQRQG